MGFSTMPNGIFHLRGTVKHYDWGGFSFIPSLLQLDNTGQRPFAEYWMGVHPSGMSWVKTNGKEEKLAEIAPQLPFLFKVLDVRKMLSIQLHPSREGAMKGYEMENEKGIPLDSPLRNYKDRNHKPELMVALDDFWLLHGFKPEKELGYTLLNVVELRELLPVYNHSGYEGLYRHIMELPQEDVNRILQPIIKNLSDVYASNEPDRDDEDYWVAKAAEIFIHDGNIDRGIFSFYIFNLVHLKKGEGIFQDAGIPHAYLEGQNVEIMANSDNVLRGGLTSKHIDVRELMKHIKYEPVFPKRIVPESIQPGEKLYKVPVNDFRLSVFEIKANEEMKFKTTSPEILLQVDGESAIKNDNGQLILKTGSPSIYISPNHEITIKSIEESLLFRASY